MMSVRGSRPKMASDSVTEPVFLPSSVVTWSSISLALLRFLAGVRFGGGLRCRRGLCRFRFDGLWLRFGGRRLGAFFAALLGGALGSVLGIGCGFGEPEL